LARPEQAPVLIAKPVSNRVSNFVDYSNCRCLIDQLTKRFLSATGVAASIGGILS